MEIAKVVIIGIVLVFLILLLLTLLLIVFRKAAGGNSPQKNTEDQEKITIARREETDGNKNAQKTEKSEDFSLICILTAAVAAYRSETGENADPSHFKVVAFHKTPRRIK